MVLAIGHAEAQTSPAYVIRPGDTLYVPRSRLSRLAPFIPAAGLGIYLNPFAR